MYQITKCRPEFGGGLIEQTHEVVKLLKWLPAGPTDNGGVREQDIVQFVARHGGIRTVAAADLVDIR